MKLRIRKCPECKRDTLQAKNKTPFFFWRDTWFCSLCGKTLIDTNHCETEVVPELP